MTLLFIHATTMTIQIDDVNGGHPCMAASFYKQIGFFSIRLFNFYRWNTRKIGYHDSSNKKETYELVKPDERSPHARKYYYCCFGLVLLIYFLFGMYGRNSKVFFFAGSYFSNR